MLYNRVNIEREHVYIVHYDSTEEVFLSEQIVSNENVLPIFRLNKFSVLFCMITNNYNINETEKSGNFPNVIFQL